MSILFCMIQFYPVLTLVQIPRKHLLFPTRTKHVLFQGSSAGFLPDDSASAPPFPSRSQQQYQAIETIQAIQASCLWKQMKSLPTYHLSLKILFREVRCWYIWGGIYLIRLNISTFGHTFWVSFLPCSLNVENSGLYKPWTYFL